MANYLLDTNHASPLVTFSHSLRERILDAMRQGHTFAICIPVLVETLFGIGTLPRAAQNRAEWQNLRTAMVCYIPDETDAELAANLQISLRRQGRQLEANDALIAIIASRYNLILLTSDRDFQPVPNIRQENWLI